MPISDVRTLVVTIGKTLSLLGLVLLLLQSPVYLAQQFPPFRRTLHHNHNQNNYIRKNEQDTFFNSHILEQELEKTVYLYYNKPRNLTITFKPGGMMTVAVTPCASEIQWSLFVKPQVGRDYKKYGQRKPHKPREKIAQFQNETRQVFQSITAPAGVYTLSLHSLHSDSRVKIIVTRNRTLQGMYPELPAKNMVHASVRKRKLIVSWSPSPMADHWTHPVQYCISISQIKNFKSHCNALAHKNGDKKPRFSRWGLPGENRQIKEWKKMAKPIRKVKKKHMFYQCVVGKTSFTYKKLRRGRKYFIDVFIVDKDTNGSSAYIGTTVERKKKKRVQKRNFAVLKMGKTRTVNLKHTRGIQLNVNQTLPKLVIEAVPCGERLPVVLYYKRTKLQSATTVRRWKRITVTPAKAGTYLMAFPGKRKKSSFVSVSASSHTKSKVLLPNSMDVTVQKQQTSCSNVTLQWMESRARQSYCLYKQIVSEPTTPGTKVKGSRRQRCVSPSERPQSELVFCDRRRPYNSQQIRVFTVPGLTRSTTYRFDLFVGNKKSGMVPYHSVKETTASNC